MACCCWPPYCLTGNRRAQQYLSLLHQSDEALEAFLQELAGLEIPPYYQFLGDLKEHIPSVSVNGYYSVSHQCFLPISQAEGEEAQWLNLYEQLQYNNLFDSKNRSTHFFGS